jgi:hypothetical protein
MMILNDLIDLELLWFCQFGCFELGCNPIKPTIGRNLPALFNDEIAQRAPCSDE